jgi:hypothetical protein
MAGISPLSWYAQQTGGLTRDFFDTIGVWVSDPANQLVAVTADSTVLPIRQHPDGRLLRQSTNTSTDWRQELFGLGRLLGLGVIKGVPMNIQLNR